MSCFCLAENHVELFLSACCTRSTIILPVIQPIKLLICGVVAAVDVIDSKASRYSFLSANETSVQITLLKRQMREAICFLFCFVLTFFFPDGTRAIWWVLDGVVEIPLQRQRSTSRCCICLWRGVDHSSDPKQIDHGSPTAEHDLGRIWLQQHVHEKDIYEICKDSFISGNVRKYIRIKVALTRVLLSKRLSFQKGIRLLNPYLKKSVQYWGLKAYRIL